MIFEFAEIRCILDILRILKKGKSKYSIMFKETKVSHTTLQNCLKELIERDFIKRIVIDHMVIDYEINEKGEKLLIKLNELREIIRN